MSPFSAVVFLSLIDGPFRPARSTRRARLVSGSSLACRVPGCLRWGYGSAIMGKAAEESLALLPLSARGALITEPQPRRSSGATAGVDTLYKGCEAQGSKHRERDGDDGCDHDARQREVRLA